MTQAEREAYQDLLIGCGCVACEKCSGTVSIFTAEKIETCEDCKGSEKAKRCPDCARAAGWLDKSKRGY